MTPTPSIRAICRAFACGAAVALSACTAPAPGSDGGVVVPGGLFAGTAAKEMQTALTARLGAGASVLKLVVRETEAQLFMPDPSGPEAVRSFTYRDGKIEGPAPVPAHPADKDAKRADRLFPLDEVDLAATPELARLAIEQNRLEGGGTRVQQMLIRRDLPFGRDVQWRVFLQGVRRSGWVDADPKGAIRRIHSD